MKRTIDQALILTVRFSAVELVRQERCFRRILQQQPAVTKESLHMGEGFELSRLGLVPAIHDRLDGPEPLLQLHEPVGKRRDRLSQVFGGSGDAK